MRIQKTIPFKRFHLSASSLFWFILGFILTALFLTSFLFSLLKYFYQGRAFEGVYIDNIYVGGKTRQEIKEIFEKKNLEKMNNHITFSLDDKIATFSASEINAGFDAGLMEEQAHSLGRSGDMLTNLYIITHAYLNGISLPTSYSYSFEKNREKLNLIQKEIYTPPVDALFTVENNKVIAFRESQNGKTIDFDELDKQLKAKLPIMMRTEEKNINIDIPIKILWPVVTTQKANRLGIVEVIGEGKSYFRGSISNRIHNVILASSRINGILVAPNETFSFNNALGDISVYTGYKQAYIIKGGKTVLGDGGGVCQVSTTLFRALLNAGLPITERHPHSYRVEYYEQNSPPGFDATVFSPTEDLKFKNDTANYILIQSSADEDNLSLTFTLYGKKDNRQITISKPIVISLASPPPPTYQDDPNLPKGETKQVEFEAIGANVTFSRKVEKNGKTIINDIFSSKYSPWQAIYLRGTKEQ
ncbi:MAG: hypothetical protein A2857_02985 [Candidatus Levybacteria bacterium RIFCSPHIGHO2_01_FULL_36_15]|nr:MAG: hypothetical protein A2857_02985 [Candidatus Levybacteria bacterium RIFCSPHIGHO2_01_FULL_36_15]